MPKRPIILPPPICGYDNVTFYVCSCNVCRKWQKRNGYEMVEQKARYIRFLKIFW